jgi:hypothetical protein
MAETCYVAGCQNRAAKVEIVPGKGELRLLCPAHTLLDTFSSPSP